MDRNRLVIATRNADKVREIWDILKMGGWELLSLLDFPTVAEIEEDGRTLLENALKKARTCFRETGIASLADDTGLEVDSLGGAPGVFASRFAGENVSYADNNRKLLDLLKDVPEEKRTARFRCVVALVDGGGERWVEGVCEGIVLRECRGEEGFGYDPVFYVPAEGKTFAEMHPNEKNRISHRGKAFRQMAELLRERRDGE